MITKDDFIAKLGYYHILELALADYSDNYIEYLEEDFCQTLKNYFNYE